MAFLTQPVTIPMWFLIMMNVIVVALLVKLFKLVYRYRRGDISREEHEDMVIWKVSTPRKVAVPKKLASDTAQEKQQEKKQEKKQDIVQVLKILIQEGDKGALLQTIADQMGNGRSHTQEALQKLVNNKLVDEVVGMSGTKYYLTEEGREYCKRKST